jgi:hypothetical protein
VWWRAEKKEKNTRQVEGFNRKNGSAVWIAPW